MALFVHEAEANAVLVASGVHEIYPTYSDMWVVDVRQHQWTLAAPVSVLMPRSLGQHLDRFKKIAPFGHLVSKAAWKCQERKDSDDFLCQNDMAFKFFAVPDNEAAYVHVKGIMRRMVSGVHRLDFELIMYNEFGVRSVIGAGSSSLEVTKGTPFFGPIVTRRRPDFPIPSSPHMSQEEEEEEVPVVMAFDSVIANGDQSPFKFTLVNASGSRPQDSTELILELSKLNIVPKNVTYEPMPTKVIDRFLFHFEVDNQRDASKIQERIRFGGGCERFKIGLLQDIKPFFTFNLPLRKLIKTIVLSHSYYESNGCVGDAAAMAEIGDHVWRALKDENVVKEVKALMSKKGVRKLQVIEREMDDQMC